MIIKKSLMYRDKTETSNETYITVTMYESGACNAGAQNLDSKVGEASYIMHWERKEWSKRKYVMQPLE
jgi:hypothetical protein